MAKEKEQTVEQIAHDLVQEFLTQLGLDAEITIVGDLPPQTAKRISDSIKFRAAQ